MTASNRSKSTHFHGWNVVGAAFVVAVFAWGIGFYGPPIFLAAIHATYGWPVSLISAAITEHFLFGAAVVANLARLHRRFGIAATTRVGAGLTAVGLLGWAFATHPWHLSVAALASGAGWAMTSGAALSAMVAPWFVRRRPAALSMAFNGASMGGVLFSPLWVALIGWWGFKVAGVAVAVAVTCVLWVLAGRYLKRGPVEMGLVPDGDTQAPPSSPRGAGRAAPLGNPWRDRRFVTLAAGSSLGLFAQIGLVAHLFSVLLPILGETAAGMTMATVTALAIGFRSLLGWIMPPDANRWGIAAGNVALQAVGSGLLLVAGPSVPMVLLGCGLFGLGLGNVTSMPPLIAQAEFAAADVARVVGLVTAVGQAGYAFAPAVFGLLRDFGQTIGAGAMPMFAVAAAVQIGAGSAMLLGGRHRAADRSGD